MALIELSAVTCLAVLPGIVAYYQLKGFKEDGLEKRIWFYISSSLLNSLGIIFVLLFIGMQQQDSLKSIGLTYRNTDNLISHLLGGMVCFAIFIWLYYLGVKIISKKKPAIDESRINYKITLSCNTNIQRICLVICRIFSSIAEELVFRGYFILLWGARTNNIVPCAIISGIIFVALHLYQGKKSIIYYVLFTVTLTWVTIDTGTIIAAISAHVYCNILSTVAIWTENKKRSKENSQAAGEKSSGYRPIVEEVRPTSKLAIAIFLLSFLGLITFPAGLIALISLVSAIIVRKKLKKQTQVTDAGLTVAAIVISSISLFFALCLIIPILLLFTI